MGTPAMKMMSEWGMHSAGSEVIKCGLHSIFVIGNHSKSSFST
jgi:hypothetical protein